MLCCRSDIQKQTKQINSKLRNKEQYQHDVESKNQALTGIRETCLWNDITSFHVTENYSVDFMHDVYEGIAAFDMANLLYRFVVEDKFFSLKVLNSNLQFFNFGSENNKPPLIA